MLFSIKNSSQEMSSIKIVKFSSTIIPEEMQIMQHLQSDAIMRLPCQPNKTIDQMLLCFCSKSSYKMIICKAKSHQKNKRKEK